MDHESFFVSPRETEDKFKLNLIKTAFLMMPVKVKSAVQIKKDSSGISKWNHSMKFFAMSRSGKFIKFR